MYEWCITLRHQHATNSSQWDTSRSRTTCTIRHRHDPCFRTRHCQTLKSGLHERGHLTVFEIADNAPRANLCWIVLHLLLQSGNLGRHFVGVAFNEILQRLPTSIRIPDDDLRRIESLLRGVHNRLVFVQPTDVGTKWRTIVWLLLHVVEHRLAEEC